MLLSKPQKFLLETLRSFGAVRVEQAGRLLGMEYPGLPTEPQIRPLACGGRIRRENGYIMEPDGKPDRDTLAAIDIMLLLEPGHIEVFQKGTPPFALTFFKQRKEKLWRYDICPVAPGKEILVSALLENINQKYRLIVLMLEAPEQQKELLVPCEHCFTWLEDGAYRFYKT